MNTSVFGQQVSSMYVMKCTFLTPLTVNIHDVVVDVTLRRLEIERLDTKDLEKGIFDLKGFTKRAEGE